MSKLPAAKDTIFALSSGLPPAAVAVVRISGPQAGAALAALTRRGLPSARRAVVRRLHAPDFPDGFDEALVLWLPGPATATGEDMAEVQCHGARAVVATLRATLRATPGLRDAAAGEFARRALANGRLSREGAAQLGRLLHAETALELRHAVQNPARTPLLHARNALLHARALVESIIDHDVEVPPQRLSNALQDAKNRLEVLAHAQPLERLSEGFRVVLAGAPNAGKSSLLNALVRDSVALVSEHAGTTRDIVERRVDLGGLPVLFMDTAGLRDAADPVEAMGVARAREALENADLILDLDGSIDDPRVLRVAAKADLGHAGKGMRCSSLTGEGVSELCQEIERRARDTLDRPDRPLLDARLKEAAEAALTELQVALDQSDLALQAEALRTAEEALTNATRDSLSDAVLDAIFSTFCLGK